MDIKVNKNEVQRCHCGAYTIPINGDYYSMSEETFHGILRNSDPVLCSCGSGVPYGKCGARSPSCAIVPEEKPFPEIKATLSNCNHCVNHWGIDLCGCGSGEIFGKCDNNLPECKLPSQDIEGGYTHLKGGWVADGSLPGLLESARAARNSQNVFRAQMRLAISETDPSIPGVTILSQSPKCGVTSFSALHDRWDPHFYISPESWFECLATLIMSDAPDRAIELVKAWRDNASYAKRAKLTPAQFRSLGIPHPTIVTRLCEKFGLPTAPEPLLDEPSDVALEEG